MWHNDTYYYSTGNLRGIAGNYDYLYADASWSTLYAIAESKADFDMALSSIGRGNWTGIGRDFREYRYFGRLQQVVIARILDISDSYLESRGFHDVKGMRSKAFQRMRDKLNRKLR